MAFAIDPVGAGMVTFAGLLMTAALTFSWRYFETVGTLFHALMLVLLAAVAGFCSSGDLFNMFVFFELLSVSAYALAGYKIEDAGSLQGALNFAVTNSIGAVMVLAGIALLYGRSGALNLAQIGTTLAAAPADRLVVVALVLLMVGFFVKAAVVPFHFWLADAYAVAPTPVCVLLAGLLSELGAVLRVTGRVFAGWDPAGPVGGRDEAAEREGPQETQELRMPRSLIGPSMLAPVLLLLGASIAIGLVPGLSDRAVVVAARFADRAGYAATVLRGAAAPAVTAPAPASGRLVATAPWAAATVLLAVAGASVALFGWRLPARLRRSALLLAGPVVRALRSLHSGQLADSVTWLTIGTAGFGLLLATVLR